MKQRLLTLFLTGVLLVVFAAGFHRLLPLWAGDTKHTDKAQPAAQKPTQAPPSNTPPKKIEIALDKATDVALPKIANDLEPAVFKTADGKAGWVVRIPGGRPIATPAFADGMVFVGGGYGSHEFYAFNAETGDLVWKMQTTDDGPTAAVVEAGYVAFNTESCTLIVVDEKTGKVIWQEWLGDPLMSQPAISKGRLFIAYPAGQGGHGQQSNNAMQKESVQKESVAPKHAAGSHVLLAVDLKTGRHLWEQEITGDVISAPVVSGDNVYFTCFDGTSFAMSADDGKLLWKKMDSATSAPVIADGQVLITRREQISAANYEGLSRLDAKVGDSRDKTLIAKNKADYLNAGNGGGVAITTEAQSSLDSGVGFGSAPESAKLKAAEQNVGVATVAGAWAYQGSRAAYSKGQMLNAQGSNLNSINAENGRANWQAEITGARVNGNAQVFSPPALGRDYMYLSSAWGHLVSVRQKDGSVGFNYFFKQPMVFQPALANGNVYAGTGQGLVICLKTGNPDADGWYEWGGNAQHNKAQ